VISDEVENEDEMFIDNLSFNNQSQAQEEEEIK